MTEDFNPAEGPGPGPVCHVLGVLDDGVSSLSERALAALRQADVVLGASRTLALLRAELQPRCRSLDWGSQLSQLPAWIREAQSAGQRCVVLATGDPLCHGIAAYLASRLCLEALEIVPNCSTIQLACARIGLPWQDLRIVSIHHKDAGEWVPGAPPSHGLYGLRQALALHDRVAVLTSPANSPDRIARLLLAEGLDDCLQLAVAERLCRLDEKVWTGLSAQQLSAMRFDGPNVVLLWRALPRPSEARMGWADHQYHQRQPEKGLITKLEARAVALARMGLSADSVVWDIGAGSGSVGLEASRMAERGHVWAIEKNEADHQIAWRNAREQQRHNYTLRHGKAPDGLDAWPDPDAVFVGGSGGELASLIDLLLARLRPGGRLVMNFVTLENLGTAMAALRPLEEDWAWDVVQLQASRSKPILDLHRMAAENPVWLVCVRKPSLRQGLAPAQAAPAKQDERPSEAHRRRPPSPASD